MQIDKQINFESFVLKAAAKAFSKVFPEFSNINIARSVEGKNEGVKLILKANELLLKQFNHTDMS